VGKFVETLLISGEFDPSLTMAKIAHFGNRLRSGKAPLQATL